MPGLLQKKYLIINIERGEEKRTPAFVLSPTKTDVYGNASRQALRAYAAVVYDMDPQLARDLVAWMNEIEGWADQA